MDATNPELANAGAAPAGPALPLTFTGTAGEFFPLWLKNVVLSILTIGIYSAWATVRERKYLLSHTFLDGVPFDYHERPLSILKGRIIAIVVLGTIGVLQEQFPIAGLIALLLVFAALPWVVNAALRFNARVTSWRGVPFDFVGSYWRSAIVHLVWPALATLSLGALAPYAGRARARYFAAGHRFGGAAFDTTIPLKPLYGALVAAVLATLALVFLLFVIAIAVSNGIALLLGEDLRIFLMPLSLAQLGVLTLLVWLYLMRHKFTMTLRREAVSGLTLEGGHVFRSRLDPNRVVWLQLQSIVLGALSLGLLIPWLTIRHRRLQTEAIEMLPAGPLDGFSDASDKGREMGNIASELLEHEGIEIGFAGGMRGPEDWTRGDS